ncbi:hypothetical protein SASPL_147932 [Salvia splendens]|uniref:PHD-type zinc finger plants domain-containing protein n=1 Tax=Salvia splendens TaxID=180675 RepID=A0A8X8Z6A2_SALSN|nr:hypothetical protein SASPL_147932 [Salvia splendens]
MKSVSHDPTFITPNQLLFIFTNFKPSTDFTFCCLCGDVGFSDKLFRCSHCRHRCYIQKEFIIGGIKQLRRQERRISCGKGRRKSIFSAASNLKVVTVTSFQLVFESITTSDQRLQRGGNDPATVVVTRKYCSGDERRR